MSTTDTEAMHRASINGTDLEYEERGAGEAVLLIPPGPIAAAFLPLMSEPSLLQSHRVIRYHRRGQARSTPVEAAVSFAEHASDAAALLSELGVSRAHVVGHSTGAAIALQLAVDHPDAVATLTLLEPPLFSVPGAATFLAKAGPALQDYEMGDRAPAMRGFLSLVSGLDWPTCGAAIDEHVPGGADRALAEAAFFFESDLPALQGWTFGEDDAAGVSQPVLSVLGALSDPLFVEGAELLRTWFPQCEERTLDGAGHLLQMQRPAPVAESLAEFFTKCSTAQPTRSN